MEEECGLSDIDPGDSIPGVPVGHDARQRHAELAFPPHQRQMPEKHISQENLASPQPQRAGDETATNGAGRQAINDLFSVTYEEMRRLASSVKRSDPSATLNPTALVNEAWLKLANAPGLETDSRLHFKRIAARAMRQLLVEAARRRNADKRGGSEGFQMVTFDESLTPNDNGGKELIALDIALQELARFEPRQALMVESRFFGGCDVSETAALLGVSEATVLRDWRAAKAWLAQALRQVH